MSSLIAEGPETIRLLLASDFVVMEILVKPSLFAGLRPSLEARAERRGEAPVLVCLCDAVLMEQISGIPARHASAALARALRPAMPGGLQEVIPQVADRGAPVRILALNGLDEESIGALLRVGAAFGIHLVLLSNDCGDPFHRRAVRVSMGHVFRVPVLRGELPVLFRELRACSVLTVAASSAADDQKDVRYLDELREVPRRWVCVVGPKGPVESFEVQQSCEVSLAVRAAVPSCPLGVGIVAAVLLHGCVEREGGCEGCVGTAHLF